MPLLLRQPRVAVVPVGGVLDDWELVDERLPGPNAGKAYARHAIHVEGHEHAVLMDGGVLIQTVGDRRPDVLSFPQMSGPGTDPLIATAWPRRPSTARSLCPMVSLISAPARVGMAGGIQGWRF